MARKHPPYAPEFRRQMIELVRAGRSPEGLAKEFEPSAQAIRNWVALLARVALARTRPAKSTKPAHAPHFACTSSRFFRTPLKRCRGAHATRNFHNFSGPLKTLPRRPNYLDSRRLFRTYKTAPCPAGNAGTANSADAVSIGRCRGAADLTKSGSNFRPPTLSAEGYPPIS